MQQFGMGGVKISERDGSFMSACVCDYFGENEEGEE